MQTGAEYVISADSSCMMHQQGCAERLGMPIKYIHIAQILNGARMNERPPEPLLHRDRAAADNGHAGGHRDLHESAVKNDRRLEHAEGASTPAPPPKCASRSHAGRRIRGNRPVDQTEAAEQVHRRPEHERMHDERLWDLRRSVTAKATAIPEWEELRNTRLRHQRATPTHLDRLPR